MQDIDRAFTANSRHVRRFSDERVFGIEVLSQPSHAFHADPNLQFIANQYMGQRTVNAFTLANRLDARPGSRGSGEGWHKDHYYRQFKAILYLVDVDEENGPFQLLPGSHHISQYLRDTRRARLGFRTLGIQEAQMEALLRSAPDRVRSLCGPAGTLILVDTACIHRGKPPTRGVRYALTNYYVERYQLSEAFIHRFQPVSPDRVRQMRDSEAPWGESGVVTRVKQTARSARTFAFMLRRNPELALNILTVRAERRLGVPLWYLSPKRTATIGLETSMTVRIDARLTRYGNYYLDPELIPANPVIFSFGIGTDIRFDRAVLERHPDATLVMADPTPSSVSFVKAQNLPPNASFHAAAVGAEDGTIRVYSDDIHGDLGKTGSVSVRAQGYHDASFEVRSVSIATLMKEHHVDRIDVLKADIEGAFLPLLEHLIAVRMLPAQIACELERPQGTAEFVRYLLRVSRVLRELRGLGYDIYRTREADRGFQVEILAVRRRR